MPSDELTTELASGWTTVAPSAMVTSDTISIATGVDGAAAGLGVRVGLVPSGSGVTGSGVTGSGVTGSGVTGSGAVPTIMVESAIG